MTAMITGFGAIAGSAGNAEELARLLLEDPAPQPLVDDVNPDSFDPVAALGRRGLARLDPCTRLALAVAGEALESAKLDSLGSRTVSQRTAVVVCCTLGVLDTVARAAATLRRSDSRALSPLDLPNASPNVAASHVAIRHGLKGPNLTVAAGPAGGLAAVAQAECLLRTRRADAVLVIGVEAVDGLSSAAVRAGLGLASGVALGSGAAALLIEAEQTAGQRNAKVCGQLVGTAAVRARSKRDADAVTRVLGAAASCRSTEGVLLLTNERSRGAARDAEHRGVRETFARRPAPRAAVKSRLGEMYGATGVFQAVAGMICIQAQRGFASPATWRGVDGVERAAPLLTEPAPLAVSRVVMVSGDVGETWRALEIATP